MVYENNTKSKPCKSAIYAPSTMWHPESYRCSSGQSAPFCFWLPVNTTTKSQQQEADHFIYRI